MAKNNNKQVDRNGKEIKIGCKVRYRKLIWEVGYCGGMLNLFRFGRVKAGEEPKFKIAWDVKADELEVI